MTGVGPFGKLAQTSTGVRDGIQEFTGVASMSGSISRLKLYYWHWLGEETRMIFLKGGLASLITHPPCADFATRQ